MGAKGEIPIKTNDIVLITLMAVGTILCICRAGARWWKVRAFQIEDFLVWFALAQFIAFCTLYIVTLPIYSRVMQVIDGKIPPYKNLLAESTFMLRCFFPIQLMYWGSLWSIKFSLLFLFKRLTAGLPNYSLAWYCIAGFTALTYILSVVTSLTTCETPGRMFVAGECISDRDIRSGMISMYFVLAADLTTDLLIMAIPIQILWNLPISRTEKLFVGVAFSVGILTMIFAIVRVAALVALTGGDTDVPFLALFACLESFVAVTVGCLPAFAIFIRGRVLSSKNIYGPNPNSVITIGSSQNNNRSGRKDSAFHDDIPLDMPAFTNDQSQNSQFSLNDRDTQRPSTNGHQEHQMHDDLSGFKFGV